MRYVTPDEHALVVVAVRAVRLSFGALWTAPRGLPHVRNRAGDRHLNLRRHPHNLGCRRMSGRGAEIRQPQIAMLAHADKQAAGPSLQDLFNDRAQPNNHLLRRTKEMSFVTTMSEAMTATAGGLQDVGSVVAATNAAAAAPTTG